MILSPAPWGQKEAFDIVPYVVGRVVEGLARGEKILFTRDTHSPDYPDTQEGRKLPVPHCIRGSEGWEIIPQLQEYAAHPIDKPTFGSTGPGPASQGPGRGSAPPGKARRGTGHPHRRMHGHLRALQRPAHQGVFAGDGDRGGGRLLRRRYAPVPRDGPLCHGRLPDHGPPAITARICPHYKNRCICTTFPNLCRHS